MIYLTEDDIKWKGVDYYISLKKKWNDDKYGIPWKKYASKPSVGSMVSLCDKWNPSSYEDFYYIYTGWGAKLNVYNKIDRGRTVDELEEIAIRWRNDANDFETPLSEYFDAIILHTVVETYVGKDFENKAIDMLNDNGFTTKHGTQDEDSDMNIDFKIYKDGELKSLVQVKPISFIISNRKHTREDRINVFEKHKKGWKKYPGIPYIYLIYDASTLKWVYNEKENRCAFAYEDLVNLDGSPIISAYQLRKCETDNLFNKN